MVWDLVSTLQAILKKCWPATKKVAKSIWIPLFDVNAQAKSIIFEGFHKKVLTCIKGHQVNLDIPIWWMPGATAQPAPLCMLLSPCLIADQCYLQYFTSPFYTQRRTSSTSLLTYDYLIETQLWDLFWSSKCPTESFGARGCDHLECDTKQLQLFSWFIYQRHVCVTWAYAPPHFKN